MANVQISHDSFARQSLVRRIVETLRRCEWCGNHRHDRNGYSKMFEYGTEPDASSRVNWHRGVFCSKSCHDSYHGL